MLTLLLLGLGGIVVGAYLFNKPRQSIIDVQAEASIAADALVSEFETDESNSNKMYLGKVIEVTGIVDATNTDANGILNITLRGGDLAGVGCQLEKNGTTKKLVVGDKVTIKGICTGILMDVVLVDCVITG